MSIVFKLAEEKELNVIIKTYKDVIKANFTTWDENYPSKELVQEDIEKKTLYVLKNKDEIVAISFLGPNENENEKWEYKLQNPLGIARICVAPKYQGQGFGKLMLKHLIKLAKEKRADGLHFHVAILNKVAIKMYLSCGFENCGKGKANYGYDYYKFEMKF